MFNSNCEVHFSNIYFGQWSLCCIARSLGLAAALLRPNCRWFPSNLPQSSPSPPFLPSPPLSDSFSQSPGLTPLTALPTDMGGVPFILTTYFLAKLFFLFVNPRLCLAKSPFWPPTIQSDDGRRHCGDQDRQNFNRGSNRPTPS